MFKRLALTLCFSAVCLPLFAGIDSHEAACLGGTARLSTETVTDARLAVRLVAADGDVIWRTTQESQGAKFQSASAGVADKVAKQLIRDVDKAASPRM